MTFSESNSAPEPTRRTAERVAEHEDEQAEAQVLSDRDIQASKDRIISQFDTSTVGITELHALVPQLRTAMDELIQKTVIRLVNVRDIKDLPPEKLAEIKEVVELRLEEFRKSVEQGAEKNSATAVAMAKEKKGLWFQDRVAIARETHNDAEFKFSVEGEVDANGRIQKPEAVTINYAEKNPKRPKVTLTVATNEHFFASSEKTVEGNAADRIQKNKEAGAYKIQATNDKIQNPDGFKKWVDEQLKALKIDANTASPQQLTRAAVDIVKKNLKIIKDPEKGFQKLPQDQMPVDQLLQTGQEGCCRHFTVATRVVMEQIQGLKGIVVFENEMNEMGHATLALARGNKITTLDPFWYAAEIQDTPDSTFDGRHGNFTSLYRTLSKAPESDPNGNLFDQGSSEKLVRQLHATDGQIPKEVREKVDNPAQAIIMRAREIILNEMLQTPDNLIATIKSLQATVAKLNPAQPEDDLALASIKVLSPFIGEVIELQKTEAGQKGLEYAARLSLGTYLLNVGLGAMLKSKTTDSNQSAINDDIIQTCEVALTDQKLDQASKQEVLKAAAEEMLNTVWRGINTSLIRAKQIGQDGWYEVEQKIGTGTDKATKIVNAAKTILEPTLQGVDKVLEFIRGNRLDKNSNEIQNNLNGKSKELEQVQPKVKGTFAEGMAQTLQSRFKIV